MINNKEGFIVSESGDGGDSARAHGLYDLFSKEFDPDILTVAAFYEVRDGMFVRHPDQNPWNNPWNFSRDQLMCIAAGFWRLDNKNTVIQLIIQWHKKHWWFAQNFQRDYSGTWKKPYPHKMTGGDPADNGKWRLFDFADPLFPHHILHLYNCARMKPPLWVKYLGKVLLWLSVRFNSKKLSNEQNQLQCMVKVAGPEWVERYKRYNPMWKAQTEYYWITQRNCHEMHYLIVGNL